MYDKENPDFLNHLTVTDFQRKVYDYTFQLEAAGIFSHRKADHIRRELTVSWDPVQGKIVDLLQENDPRSEVVAASNILEQTHESSFAAVTNSKIHEVYVGDLPDKIRQIPRMTPLLSVFPEISLGNVTLYIYGENHDPSYWGHLGNDKYIAVAPDYFGLPTRLLEIVGKTYPLGLFPHKIGRDLIFACQEIIAQEGHKSSIGVVWMIKNDILKNRPVELRELAIDFILGDVEPLLSLLEKENPLAPALLSFISPLYTPNDTPTSIERYKVIKALR